MAENDRNRPRVGVISLGCAKNLVDTEIMLGHLDLAGCTFSRDPAEAEVVLINTCSFIDAAREESVRTILETAEWKKTGRLKKLVVAGCLVQRYPGELQDSLPEVDVFLNLDELDRVAPVVTGDLPMVASPPAGPAGARISPSRFLYDHRAPRRLSTPSWSAFVKIAEGCDHRCSFCAIPSFRGSFRSRPVDDIVAETERLAAEGVREVQLIAQDSSRYGRDLGLSDGLPDLLEALDRVDALRWIRVHYLYPNTVTRRLMDAMAGLERVVKYVDIPLQHADAAVLKRMARGGTTESHLRLLSAFRQRMPDVAVRSTFIVGFPGETEEEFRNLLAFVGGAEMDHLGVFTYSHEEDTSAFGLEDDVPWEVKEERRDRLMSLQAGIVARKQETRVGSVVEVLVEGPHPETEHLLHGRMSIQAPDVDGCVLINDGAAEAGSFVSVELTEVAGYDMVGRIRERS